MVNVLLRFTAFGSAVNLVSAHILRAHLAIKLLVSMIAIAATCVFLFLFHFYEDFTSLNASRKTHITEI
jgi:hypothetical protein